MTINQKLPGVIVIGDHVQGLGIIRNLGEKQIPVYLVHDKNICIGRFSKYLKKFLKSPKMTEQTEIINFMVKIAKKYNLFGFVLMPTNDAAVYVLSKNKSLLEEYYKIPTPDYQVVNFVYNKKLTCSLAEKNGIPIPSTFYPKTIKDLDEISSNISFPAILKGTIGHEFYRRTGAKTYLVESKKELVESYSKVSSLIEPSKIMLQEVITGPTELVYSFCSFFKNGEVVGWWTGRKIRSHPMVFGTGTFAESVYEPQLLELGQRFLRSINYYGVSEIEFKLDPIDGKFKLIEMNARTWLWHSLATRCGVNFPYMLYSDMIGKQISSVTTFKENVKWMHIYTDLAVMFNEVLRNKMGIRAYFSYLNGDNEFAVFSIKDPLPFIAETLLLPYLWIIR